MKRVDGWVRQGVGTAAVLLVFTAVVLLPIGVVLVSASDAVAWVSDRIGALL